MHAASSRRELVFSAKVLEQAEHWEEMLECMKHLVKLRVELTEEERNLFFCASKCVTGTRRASWRVLSDKISKESDTHHQSLLQDYRGRIESELTGIIETTISLLDDILIPDSVAGSDAESKAFFLKMKGDQYRFLAEFSRGEARTDASGKALSAYDSASEFASELEYDHQIRLALALNLSLHYREIVQDRKKAIEIALRAFEDAIDVLDCLGDDDYWDSTLIMQLLKDNVDLWRRQEKEEGEASGDSVKFEDCEVEAD